MWISDDTTWNRTAQRRELSSDVMPLSSPGKSQRYRGGNKRNGSWLCRSWIGNETDRSRRNFTFARQHIFDLHSKQLTNWGINL